MPFCQNCGEKSLQESPYGPSGGSPFQTFVLRVKEETFRHKEIDAIISCVIGLIIFLASFVIRLPLGSGLTNLGLMVSGLLIIFISTISSQYYRSKQKNLMKTHS
jgi:hypothetical protein